MNPATTDLITSPELTADQVTRYRRQGYLVTAVLFDPATVAAVQTAFDRHWDIIRYEQAGHRGGNHFPIGMTDIHPELRAFALGPVFQNLCRAICGPDAVFYWDQGIFKPGRTGGSFAWHQDARYAITEPLDPGFTCWYAVRDTTIANGTLWVAPDEYRPSVIAHEWIERSHEWRCVFANGGEPASAVPLELKAGQMLIFSRLIPHASGPNTTDAVRQAFQLGYAPTRHATKLGHTVTPILRDGSPA